MKTSVELNEILPAVMKVKSKLQAIVKTTSNPFFRSKFADLNTHLDAVEPLLEENELMLLQPVTVLENGNNVVSSVIINKTGQFVSSEMTIVAKELDMQKLGSSITYARRYTLGSLLSMQAVDDDANLAVGKTDKPTTKPSPTVALTVAAGTVPPMPTQETKTDRPSFRRPAKTTTTPAPTAEVQTSGDDL